jgi:uncharacterized protein YlzI (FlbEa/FlbD family)
MIKVTHRLFEITEATTKKINNLSAAYQKAVDEYEAEMIRYENNPYGEAPIGPSQPPTYKMKEDDYKITEVPAYINPAEIVYVSESLEKDTVIMLKIAKEIVVKETVEEVYALINK